MLSSSGDRVVVLSVDLVVLLLKDSLPVTNETIGMSADKLHTLVGFSQKGLKICKINICYRPQTKLRKGNVLTSVFQEFCPQWWPRRPL